MAEELSMEGVSLLDLAGLDVSQGFEAKRIGDVLPRMFAQFECVEADLKPIEKDGKTQAFSAQFGFKVLGVITMLDKVDEKEVIGKIHREQRYIKNKDGIEFCLGFLEDIGVKEKGKLLPLIKSAEGKKIQAVLSHRKDKNDSDKVYAGLVKIKPVA